LLAISSIICWLAVNYKLLNLFFAISPFFMIRLIIFIFLNLSLSFTNSAQTLRFRCVDGQDGSVLSNASICYLKQRSVCVTADSQGVVLIPFFAGDTLFFSRVGYAQKLFPSDQMQPDAVISMTRNVIELPLLELPSSEFIYVNEIGSSPKMADGRIMMFPQLELGRLFSVRDTPTTLVAFTLHFAPLIQSTQLLSFAVFRVDSLDQTPLDKLYEQFFRIQAADIPVTQRRVVLSKAIRLPGTFVLAIRFIGVELGNARPLELLISTRVKGVDCFERYFSDKWARAPRSFFLTARSRQNRPEKPSVLLQVELGRNAK
jgi:hypothetical protein